MVAERGNEMMPEVYKYICGCGYWWAATSADRHCPKCGGDELVSRVFLESEEAAMLAALGALTFERDEARRWARHFYRLWKAFDTPANEKPFTVNVTGIDHLQQAAEALREAVTNEQRTVASKGRKAKEAK